MSSYFVVKKETVVQTLATPPISGGGFLEPFTTEAIKNSFPMKILEDVCQTRDAEIHLHESDLWICLEGTANFVCGGHLANPQFRQLPNNTENKNELYASEIVGGDKVVLEAGEYLYIPAGVPHQHGSTGVVRLGIIKIAAK